MFKIVPLSEDKISESSKFLFETEIGKKYYLYEKNIKKALINAYDKDYIFLAYENNIIIGVLWFLENGAFNLYPYLHILVVDQKHRGNGYGKKLLSYMEKKLLEKKITNKIYLLVNSDNKVAQKMYYKAGYNSIAYLKDIYIKGVDEKKKKKFLSKLTKI